MLWYMLDMTQESIFVIVMASFAMECIVCVGSRTNRTVSKCAYNGVYGEDVRNAVVYANDCCLCVHSTHGKSVNELNSLYCRYLANTMSLHSYKQCLKIGVVLGHCKYCMESNIDPIIELGVPGAVVYVRHDSGKHICHCNGQLCHGVYCLRR